MSSAGSVSHWIEQLKAGNHDAAQELWQRYFDLAQHERRQKRGGGQVQGESAWLDGNTEPGPGIEQVVGPEPTPEFAAQVAEEYQRRLDGLGDSQLRSIALWKMEGHSNDEIAARLGCVPRTVERRLQVIRSLWIQGGEP